MKPAPRRRGFHPRQLVYGLALLLIGLVVRDVFFPSGFRRTVARCDIRHRKIRL